MCIRDRLYNYFISRLGGYRYRRGWMRIPTCPYCGREHKLGVNLSLHFLTINNECSAEYLMAAMLGIDLCGVILVSRVTEIFRRFNCILLHGLACQVFLAQTVGGVGVSVLNCSLQPLDAIGSVMDHRIVREI